MDRPPRQPATHTGHRHVPVHHPPTGGAGCSLRGSGRADTGPPRRPLLYRLRSQPDCSPPRHVRHSLSLYCFSDTGPCLVRAAPHRQSPAIACPYRSAGLDGGKAIRCSSGGSGHREHRQPR